MQARHLAVASVLFLSACQTLDQGLEQEVMNSIPFDDTPCPALIAERNALAAEYALPVTVEREPRGETRLMGVGPVVPDFRSDETRARGLAIGRIDAMNRSLTRRACI